MLPDELRRQVDGELANGETIHWEAQPAPRSFPWGTLGISAFGLPWTLFSLFWIGMASGVQHPFQGFQGFSELDATGIVFSLFGVPFVLIGFGMLSAPIWIRRRILRSAERTAYVITNQRAIVFDGGYQGDSMHSIPGAGEFSGRGRRICSFYPNQLRKIDRIEDADGFGDVVLAKEFVTDSDGCRATMTAGFFSIPRVKHVEELLKNLARQVEEAY